MRLETIRVLVIGFTLTAIFVLVFLLTGPAIDHEFDEMERRARDAQREEP